jgi:hypothetical protein
MLPVKQKPALTPLFSMPKCIPFLPEIINEVTVGTVPIKVRHFLVIEVTDPVVAFHFKLLELAS